MKPRKSTSSFSKREKIRRKPFNRRNKRSTSLRLLYISMSYVHGETRVEDGGTTGVNPSANASWRVSLPSYARSITIDKFSRCGPRRLSSLRPSGASWACPAERENIRATRLLVDGFNREYEQAVVVSNDADFSAAMRYVRDDLGLRVTLVNPDPKTTSPRDLSNAATYVKRIWKSHLRRSQFPDSLSDKVGVISKPAGW